VPYTTSPGNIANLSGRSSGLVGEWCVTRLMSPLGIRLLLPDPKGPRARVDSNGCHNASAWTKATVDHAMRRRESLHLGRRFKMQHLSLSTWGLLLIVILARRD
jgi:hypothetical protein